MEVQLLLAMVFTGNQQEHLPVSCIGGHFTVPYEQ
mgnify:CR=1 FL=1